jgi:hypothetical protein
MSQPQGPYGQQPYPQQQPYGPPQGQPAPYGQPGYGYGYQQPMPQQPYPQQPMQVQQVGYSVTKPAWTIGQIMLVIFTGGLAWPFIWLSRRSRTTVTRHH